MASNVADSLFWTADFIQRSFSKPGSLQKVHRLVVCGPGVDGKVLDTLQAETTIDISEISEEKLGRASEILICLGHKYVGYQDICGELESALSGLLDILKPLSRAQKGQTVRIITRCESALVGFGGEREAHAACTAGLSLCAASRSIMLEHTFERPFNLQCIALADLERETLTLLSQAITSPISAETPLLHLKSGSVYAQRLGPATPARTRPNTRPNIQAGSAYVVTGGRTGLGWRTVEWLLKQGAHVIVMSTKPESKTDASQKDLINKHRANVFWPGAVDILEEGQVHGAIKAFTDQHPGVGIRGVFHSAAVFCQRLLPDLTKEDVWDSFRPKVLGAIHLHVAIRQAGFELDHFMLFSSITVVIGNPYQVVYSAANAGLEIVACMLRAHGVPAQSIQWSAMDLGSVDDPRVKAAMEARGMAVMGHKQIENGLCDCVRSDFLQVVVSAMDSDLCSKSVFANHNPMYAWLFGVDAAVRPELTVAEMFVRIAEVLRLMPKHMEKMKTETKLHVQALFKQATEGDCPLAPTPDHSRNLKLRAWMQLRGMTQAESRREYVDVTAKTFEEYTEVGKAPVSPRSRLRRNYSRSSATLQSRL